MIVDWIISLGTGFATWLGTLFPAYVPPDWMTDPTSLLGQIAVFATGMGVWVPQTVIVSTIAAVVLSWSLTTGVALIKTVISHIPFVGGH